MPIIKYLLFSDKLKLIGLFVKLQLLKAGRILTILFKRNRRIEKVSFGYYKKWHFDNAYLFVDFKFKNAVWFRIGNYKSYDFSRQIVLDLENIQTQTVLFEVFGFFQKQVYEINLNKEVQINTQPFKTKIDNINTFELTQQKTRIQILKIAMRISNPSFAFEKISVIQKNIQLNHKPFKIQDYL